MQVINIVNGFSGLSFLGGILDNPFGYSIIISSEHAVANLCREKFQM